MVISSDIKRLSDSLVIVPHLDPFFPVHVCFLLENSAPGRPEDTFII